MKLVIVTMSEPDQIVYLEDDNSKGTTVWIKDGFPIENYQTLIKNHGVPSLLVSDSYPQYPYLDATIDFYYLPTSLYAHYVVLDNNIKLLDHVPEYCFNFVTNRKNINRYLLLKLVEWFDLSSCRYTWSGAGSTVDMSNLFGDFNLLQNQVPSQEFMNHMLGPVSKIKPYFVDTNNQTNQGILDKQHRLDIGSIEWAWDNILNDIMSRSCVSMISESIGYENAMQFTEKTLYSVMALTFPIWIGGYKQAEAWTDHGFDTFDDIIDHSYQHYDSLLERCFYAFRDNLKILTDFDHACHLKQKNMHRLLQNRSEAKKQLQKTMLQSWQKIPNDVLKTYWTKYLDARVYGFLNK